jgi:hypothetical protein
MLVSKRQRLLTASVNRGRSLDFRLSRQRKLKKSQNWLKAQQLRRKRSILKPVCLILAQFTAATLILLGGYLALSACSWFELRQVQITGVNHLSRLDILSAAGLGLHSNLLNIKPPAAEEGIRALPWVSGVSVSRVLPDQINIQVEEEIPRAVGLIDGCLFYLNKNLKPFAPFVYDEKFSLPVISGLSRADFLHESQETEEALARGSRLLQMLENWTDPLLGELSQLEFDGQMGMKAAFANIPAAVKTGVNFDERKYKMLQQVLLDLAARGEMDRALSIDITGDKRIIVRLGQQEQ